ncbi:MAG TPA: ATP-binding cassette domain-containing protein [Candidatus Lustribacter sp.]|nr:ATP-binding cassette domain-containing protein [Candidatus Lustribacter sp.]
MTLTSPRARGPAGHLAPGAPPGPPGVLAPPGAKGRVELDALTWRPVGRRQPVLDAVSLSIAPGERVLLAGASGSGKSTLLRALAGLLLTADSGDLSGTVRIDGAAPGAIPGQVGLVLQEPGSGVVAGTVERDVAFGLENLGEPSESMPGQVAQSLTEVRLGMPSRSSTGALSGGEHQRLALAGALAMGPDLLLLDEPTAMLDAASADAVRDAVDRLTRARGLTLVVVEHRLGPWLPLVDRLVVLHADGHILADGVPQQVLAGHGADLLEAGLWLPGAPAPDPLDLGDLLPGPAGGVDRPVMSARDVTIIHRSTTVGGSTRVTTAVRDADVDLTASDLVAIVGPSGSGKSSLLAALAGLVTPVSGVVEAAAQLAPGPGRRDPARWSSPELARRVAWVPQNAASTLIASTVLDEVMATPRALGLDEAPFLGRAHGLLDRLGLAALAGADPRHLSGGEQRRLAVAAAAVHEPALVLADEPTVGQDRHTWAAVVGVLRALQSGGSALAVTTHDEDLVRAADTVLALSTPAGAIRQPGPSARRPLVTRAGPLSLLLATLVVLPLPALIDSWRQALSVLAVEAALTAVALAAPGRGAPPSGRLRLLVTRMWPPALGMVTVAWSVWLLGGHDIEAAATAALRVLALVYPGSVVLPYLDPDQLGDHLAQRLHLPARPVVAATAALGRFQSFGALWGQVSSARRVRGVGGARGLLGRGREVVAVTVALLGGALGSAAVLALAMDARGFAAAHRRTWFVGAPWRRADTAVIAAALAVVAAAACARTVLPLVP